MSPQQAWPEPVEYRSLESLAWHHPGRLSLLLMAACVVVAVFTLPGSRQLLLARLYNSGAKVNPNIAAGEWWRLLTSAFLHAGWLHLVFDLFALVVVGSLVEKVLGPARFLPGHGTTFKDVRRFTARVLRECGYAVLEAESGHAALALARDHAGPVHLLLTDAVMPGMSGKILAERLRAVRPETAVVFMSGYTDDAVLTRNVVEAGITFLQKPFTPIRLAAVVRTALDEAVSARDSSAAR